MADEEKNVEQAEAQQPVEQTAAAPQAEESTAQQTDAPAEATKPSPPNGMKISRNSGNS